jgi:hypothetical protein
MNVLEICNNNSKNLPTNDVYNVFNDFIFSSDIKLLGKLLHRFQFFNEVKDLPGDIVEIGVFKGSGIATFSKFVEIFSPNSNKKIIGFDIFNTHKADIILDKDNKIDKESMKCVYSKVDNNELTLNKVKERLEQMNIDKKYILVEGDVEESIPNFIKENPGLRISLLYIDVDLERPTYYALKYLWDRILPGGIIIFDEYFNYPGWKLNEFKAFDEFIKTSRLQYRYLGFTDNEQVAVEFII